MPFFGFKKETSFSLNYTDKGSSDSRSQIEKKGFFQAHFDAKPQAA
jgi:hypothetical protein